MRYTFRFALICILFAGCSNSHHRGPDSGEADVGTLDAASDVPNVHDAAADAAVDSGPLMGMCPSGLDPYNPDNPVNACSREGATCSEGSQCGSAMFCECTDERWNCAVAHPDPVCTCGREPSAGDPCTEEGATCGECCPAPGVPAWEPMSCIGGEWQPVGCPPIPCPELAAECPVDPAAHVGEACSMASQVCGDACCGTGIECNGTVWERGPEVGCACAAGRECGGGECPVWQVCRQTCGPADGPIYTCITPPAGCDECSCLPVGPGQRCEMVDGAAVISSVCG